MYLCTCCISLIRKGWQYAVTAQTSLAPLSWFHGSRVSTAHVHQCCRFQSYAKTVPSRMKLTMKLTMRDGIHDNGPRDHGVWRLTLALYYFVSNFYFWGSYYWGFVKSEATRSWSGFQSNMVVNFTLLRWITPYFAHYLFFTPTRVEAIHSPIRVEVALFKKGRTFKRHLIEGFLIFRNKTAQHWMENGSFYL